jgi:predicted site-specific integrase-resolvase
VVEYAFGNDLGDDTPTEPTTKKKVIGMCRVSSRKQATKSKSSDASSLDHQEQRIREYLTQEKNRVGGDDDYELEIIHSVGSGLNYERKELLDLVRRMVSGELRGCRLILTTKDRLVRFGWELMNFLANYGGVTIEYCCAEEDQTENETLAEDVISVMQRACALVSGRKARKILKVILDPQSLQTAYRMKKAGRSYRYIADHFKSKKITDEKGRAYSATIIRKNLNEQWKNLQTILPT